MTTYILHVPRPQCRFRYLHVWDTLRQSVTVLCLCDVILAFCASRPCVCVRTFQNPLQLALALVENYGNACVKIKMSGDLDARFSSGCDLAMDSSTGEGPYFVPIGGAVSWVCAPRDQSASVTWEKDGVVLATETQLKFSPVLVAHQGLYACVVQTSACAQTLRFSLTVEVPVWGRFEETTGVDVGLTLNLVQSF